MLTYHAQEAGDLRMTIRVLVGLICQKCSQKADHSLWLTLVQILSPLEYQGYCLTMLKRPVTFVRPFECPFEHSTEYAANELSTHFG